MDFKDLGRDGQIEIPIDRILQGVVLVVVFAMVLFLGYTSFYTVDSEEQAVVLRFGEYRETTEPGLHFRIPFVDTILKVSLLEHNLRLPFGVADRPTRASEDVTLMLTGDLNAASVEWTVQWKVTDAQKYVVRFYRANDDRYVEGIITTVAQAVMNRLVGDYSIDEVLTEKRGVISEQARDATQAILDSFKCGVSITDLQMQRVTPPERVKPSFDDVNSSRQLREKLENEANKERNMLLPAAEAKKDKLIREAQGYADRRRAEANGEIAALLAKYRAYEKAPEVTKQRLYLEAMQEILGQVESKTVIDGDLKSVLPMLDLNEGTQR